MGARSTEHEIEKEGCGVKFTHLRIKTRMCIDLKDLGAICENHGTLVSKNHSFKGGEGVVGIV